MTTEDIKQTVWEGSTPVLLARIYSYTGAAITQASLSTVHYHVEDTASVEIIASTALTISSIIFDTLQTDAAWTLDALGYNFKHQLTAAALPDGDTTYLVKYKFVDTSGGVWFLPFRLPTKEQPFD